MIDGRLVLSARGPLDRCLMSASCDMFLSETAERGL